MMSFFYRLLNNRKGFTLIEVLVVVAIIGILAAIATPIILNRIEKARISADEALAKSLDTALALYMVDAEAEAKGATVAFPDDITVLWAASSNYLDSKTIDFITDDRYADGVITGRVLTITYNEDNGVFDLAGYPGD